MVIPDTAFLDADYRAAMAAMLKGDAFDAEAIFRQKDPAVIHEARLRLAVAQAWVAGSSTVDTYPYDDVADGGVDFDSRGVPRSREAANVDCLDCGACCEQGWRVDVEASDLERMSRATQAAYVVPGSTRKDAVDGDSKRVFVATLALVQIGPPKHAGLGPQQQCACLGPGSYACSIYEERPEICRTFPKGHARCVQARVEKGLPIGPG